jgi:hypothetical protein
LLLRAGCILLVGRSRLLVCLVLSSESGHSEETREHRDKLLHEHILLCLVGFIKNIPFIQRVLVGFWWPATNQPSII